LKPSAAALTQWRTINWAASVVLVLPVVIAAALVRSRADPLKATLMVASLGGAAIAAGHGLYGIIYRVLTVAGVVEVDGRPFDATLHGRVLWDLFVFEPWFLIEGLLFRRGSPPSQRGLRYGRNAVRPCRDSKITSPPKVRRRRGTTSGVTCPAAMGRMIVRTSVSAFAVNAPIHAQRRLMSTPKAATPNSRAKPA
jgi:hypothetical protein